MTDQTGVLKFSAPPTALTFGGGVPYRTFVTIHPDGKVVIADDVTLDEAARGFWEAVRGWVMPPNTVQLQLHPVEYAELLRQLLFLGYNLAGGRFHNAAMSRQIAHKIAAQGNVTLDLDARPATPPKPETPPPGPESPPPSSYRWWEFWKYLW